jgi:hypothetical protein
MARNVSRHEQRHRLGVMVVWVATEEGRIKCLISSLESYRTKTGMTIRNGN